MIRLPEGSDLPAAEWFGLRVLVDTARLLPVSSPSTPAVAIEVTDDVTAAGVPETWRFDARDGVVRVPRGTARRVTELAGAALEQTSTSRDRHDRVPASENPLVQVGREREAVVNAAARALREAAVRASGDRPLWCVSPWPEGRRWAVALTHDVDVVDYWPLFLLARAGGLAGRGQWRLAGACLKNLTGALGQDPVIGGVEFLLGAEASIDVPSTWFLLCERPTLSTAVARDVTYRCDGPRARRILESLGRAGHEVALHGSFAAATDSARLAAQRSRLAELARTEIRGVRQHFLRMRPGESQRSMARAGFSYDATYGFPDRGGNRLGIADVAPGWDEASGCAMELDEVPLTWMDRSASKYRGVEIPRAWVDDGLALADAARREEGLWVGLWHPYVTDSLGFPGANEAFLHLLDALRSSRPYFGRLRDLVDWRRLRRGLRIAGLRDDGAPIVVSPEPGAPPLTVEDAVHTGRTAVVTPGAARG